MFIFLLRFHYFDTYNDDLEIELLFTMTERMYVDLIVRLKINAQIERFHSDQSMFGHDMTVDIRTMFTLAIAYLWDTDGSQCKKIQKPKIQISNLMCMQMGVRKIGALLS